MHEIFQNGEGVQNNGVRLPAFDIHHEPDAAGVMLVGRVVQALRSGKTGELSGVAVRHGVTPSRCELMHNWRLEEGYTKRNH
jgi:hypothetical protein